MREVKHYKDQVIGICDDGPLGFEDGTYIACLQSSGWSLYYSQGEMLVSGYPEHQGIQDKSLAIETVKSLIDQDLERWKRNEAEYFANKEAEQLALIQSKERERRALFKAGDAEVPVELLIKLHNAAPSDSDVREDVLSFIKTTAKIHNKAHWTRGIRVHADGSLSFSKLAYTIAVYRGKQETRTGLMMDLVEKLSTQFDSFREFHACESDIALGLGDEPGESLVEISECSARLSQLRMRLVEMQSRFSEQDSNVQDVGSRLEA